MSNYATIQTAVLTIIRLLDTYDEENCKEGDYRILDAGNNYNVVLTPGNTEHLRADQQSAMRAWVVNIDFFATVRTEETLAWANFITKRDELLTHLEKYPTLNHTANVIKSRWSASDDPLAVPTIADEIPFSGALDMIWQELTGAIVVNYNISGGEYA